MFLRHCGTILAAVLLTAIPLLAADELPTVLISRQLAETEHLRAIRKGDRIFYYHTGKEKAVVAIARAAGDAYPDPNDPEGKAYVVDVAAGKKLPRAVTLAEIKADRAFSAFPLVRMSRLSVMPVSDAEWTRIEKMSRE